MWQLLKCFLSVNTAFARGWRRVCMCSVKQKGPFRVTHDSLSLLFWLGKTCQQFTGSQPAQQCKSTCKGTNNSQHCWPSNVVSCCVRVGSGVQMDATARLGPAVYRWNDTSHTTLEIMCIWGCVAPTMLDEQCKRIQHCCATLRRSRNKRNIGSCWRKRLTGFKIYATTPNNMQHHATGSANGGNI